MMAQGRDNRGRFTVGNGLSKGFGRPMEHRKRQLQARMDEEFTDDVIIGLIWEQIEIGRKNGSAKSINAAVDQINEIMDIKIEVTNQGDSVSALIEQWRISKLAIIEDVSEGTE